MKNYFICNKHQNKYIKSSICDKKFVIIILCLCILLITHNQNITNSLATSTDNRNHTDLFSLTSATLNNSHQTQHITIVIIYRVFQKMVKYFKGA